MRYSYNIHFKRTHFHANVDALSRLPIRDDNFVVDDDAMNINFIQAKLENQWPLKVTEIITTNHKDKTLQLRGTEIYSY